MSILREMEYCLLWYAALCLCCICVCIMRTDYCSAARLLEQIKHADSDPASASSSTTNNKKVAVFVRSAVADSAYIHACISWALFVRRPCMLKLPCGFISVPGHGWYVHEHSSLCDYYRRCTPWRCCLLSYYSTAWRAAARSCFWLFPESDMNWTWWSKIRKDYFRSGLVLRKQRIRSPRTQILFNHDLDPTLLDPVMRLIDPSPSPSAARPAGGGLVPPKAACPIEILFRNF